MYKNQLNQRIVALILLFSSCFLTKKLNAQIISAASPPTYADANTNRKTNPSLLDETTTVKPAATDTTWKPIRRLWGYAFGDFYYNAHADAGNRGAETNYNGVPTYRNAFQFRRIYLGYDYDIDRKFSVELILASEPNANTAVSGTTIVSNGDNLADNKMAFYIKIINLRWKNIFKGTDFVIGQMWTPGWPLLTEKIWGYRFIEKTVADVHRNNPYDFGAALQGTFDPATKNFGYNVMVGDNTQASLLSAANANTGFFKAFYGDVYAKFLDQKLIFDLYADYMQTASSAGTIGQQARNMVKGFAAYTTPKITFGVEAYTQQIKNGVTNKTAASVANATVNAISVYTHGAITKDKLGFFARYDGYNPDNSFNAADIYTINTNLPAYSPYTKEHFVTAGLDFTPNKSVHFAPNIWFIQYKDQRDPSTTGYIPDSHVLVYRATFFYTFGK
ncbi:hypothetical protein FO440_03310 [Mucilaginibacter corticis]|uniref:Porin n=1 Tax=Mucilaginibacter corticis TaxID=2597670 RepID=A0A556MTQ2_9SPHI|nr:hypothetical protein [Mucilaginibacter corticis]TSJ43235.1 hypothetical protein FO440_03310 [Mucilaginibacter corticis]